MIFLIFLNIHNKKYSISRIEHLLRNLTKKKKGMKRLSEQKKKVIEQISFYQGILEKLQQYEGDIHYGNENNEPIFTEKEIFYISMILGMRDRYQRMKQLSKLRFIEHENIHKDLQTFLRQVIELSSTLFDYYLQLNRFYNRIYLIDRTVEFMIKPVVYESSGNNYMNQYQIWIQNLVNSFELLLDYESWRRNNFHNDKWMGCCQAPCYCYINAIEEKMYQMICRNVFFNRHRHQIPPSIYWSNKAFSSFL
jgi:hypothetical protein